MTNKPIWTPIKIRLGDIEMWEDNPRMSTKAQAQRIIKSESEFGQPVPFALSPFDKNGKAKLYDGHQRVSAWLTVYGEKHIMDAMQCNRYLTDDERKKLVISLHSGATGSWNWDVLSGWDSQNLLDWGMDNNKLKDLKTDASALSNLINSETPPQDNEVILDQAIQLKPSQEYIVVVCESSEQFEELKKILKLPYVRRGGYKKGSQFDGMGLRCVKEDGGFLAARYFFWENSHWTDDGGCKDYRTQEMEMDAINKLMKMYPNSIRKVTRGGSKYSIHLDF